MKFRKSFPVLAALSLVLASCNNPETSSEETAGGSYPTYDEPSIVFHYQRGDDNYENWNLWIWAEGLDGASYQFNGQDGFGAVASYPLSTWDMDGADGSELGFIVRQSLEGNEWAAKDTEADRFVDFSALTADEGGAYHVYLKSGDANIYTTPDLVLADAIEQASFTTFYNITVKTSNPITECTLNTASGSSSKDTAVPIDKPAKTIRISLPKEEKCDFEKSYTVSVKFEESGATLTSLVSLQPLFKSADFNSEFNYRGDDLGVTVVNGKTNFKVWSPVSSRIALNVYDNGTPTSVDPTKGSDKKESYEMSKGEYGVFSYSLEGSLYGKYYTYTVYNATYPEGREVVDPYARSAGVNGLRGMIVDFTLTNPEGWADISPYPYDRKELVVYETHVSDVTSSPTWKGTEAYRKKFLGMAEKGTTYSEGGTIVKTGLDHIAELGVNAVQLLPIFDQANDETKDVFNWGYNPLNYNVVEGLYSTNPYDGYARIRELKALILALHDEGINVIMDVVYNHTNGLVGSSFDVLMPGYYYRYAADGTASNGTGCGNETASEMFMYRKFMMDSTAFWAKEYKLGGFRFDLMGCHDVETMNRLVANLKAINPDIVVYGEPWTGGTSSYTGVTAIQNNLAQFQGFGQFNDGMRDALIRGGLSAPTDRGWVSADANYDASGDASAIIYGLKGATYNGGVKTADPDKTNNYVTCHDNYTLFDRFYYGIGGYDEDTVAKMSVAANAIVMASQGTSFMQGGEELLRSKGGNSNSYNASYEVNEIDYSTKVERPELFESYRKLIALKTGVDGLHLAQAAAQALPDATVGDGLIVVDFADQASGLNYRMAVTNGNGKGSVVDFGGYSLYLDSLASSLTLGPATLLGAYQVVVGYK